VYKVLINPIIQSRTRYYWSRNPGYGKYFGITLASTSRSPKWFKKRISFFHIPNTCYIRLSKTRYPKDLVTPAEAGRALRPTSYIGYMKRG
jgi:hypothetical protein